MSKKRTLDAFFTPKPQQNNNNKKPRLMESTEPPSNHPTYPFPLAQFPTHITEALASVPATKGNPMNNQPDLDLIWYQPFLPRNLANSIFEILRTNLFFYRVTYTIKRGNVNQLIHTPRFTTVFGIDESARFDAGGGIVDARTGSRVGRGRYGIAPRPIPGCLDLLRRAAERVTGEVFNFCLVNYYGGGGDGISFHSDDEAFLGVEPAIASFSLGAERDFLMKRKGGREGEGRERQVGKLVKVAMGSGDMVLMRGKTQGSWVHSIPKRKGGEAGKGRINITFRRAMVRAGTDNYYRYNVGEGCVFVWDGVRKEMVEWKGEGGKEGKVEDRTEGKVDEVSGERAEKEKEKETTEEAKEEKQTTGEAKDEKHTTGE
ncbi:hypothetical protein EG328_000652 [Venturia inaequalis]|uniref:Fe2OG dioxygenase domain-containing protein n=1 Tax=Venturia inaequalis TaxID=5025 RepID=A0A8H3V0L1_VENIN|nr:hypothetical protein EG328_000652 [Venturia inaequalis]